MGVFELRETKLALLLTQLPFWLLPLTLVYIIDGGTVVDYRKAINFELISSLSYRIPCRLYSAYDMPD